MYPHVVETMKFSCGDKDLDDFFFHDAEKFESQLLGRSYSFRLKDDNSVIVCAFTLSNASIDCIFRSKPSHCPQCFCQLGCMVFMHFLCKIVQKQHFFST